MNMSTTATKMVDWPAQSGATICPETLQGIVAVAAINAILRVQSAQLGIEGIVVGRTGDIVPAFGQLIGFAGLFFAISRSMIHISTSAVMKPENTIDSGTFSELENKKTSAAKLASITL